MSSLQGHTFFVGDSKTEHPAVDPDITKQRYVQNMTHEGGILGVELTYFVKQLEMANGELPTLFSADVTRIVAAVEGALIRKQAARASSMVAKGQRPPGKMVRQRSSLMMG